MSGKKTIELKFGEDESPAGASTNVTTKPKEPVTKHNFNGFIIEVTRTKDRKPISAEIKFCDENTLPNVNGCDNVNTPSIPTNAPQSSSAPVAPKTDAPVTQLDLAPAAVDELEGAAGLWAENDPRAACFQGPEVANVFADNSPTITEADYEQFDPEELEDACYGKLLLLGEEKLIKNREDFVCSICEEFIVKHQGNVLKACLHNFCSPCLVKHITENHNDFEVACPFSLNPCEGMLDYDEIKELLGIDFAAFELNIVQLMDETLRERERLEQSGANELLPFLIQSDEQHYIENYEAFECQVCFVDTEIGDGIILKKCLHKFCKVCLIATVKHSDDFEVKCPHNDPDYGNCKEFLTEREILYIVPNDIFEKHLEKSLKLYEGTYAQALTHCLTPDCRGFVEADANLRGFTCQVCQIVNCIGCKAIHQGKNCQQYQDEINPDGARRREDAESTASIQTMVANNEAMYCPRCGIPVLKTEGCDFITCTACKLGICWRTRKPRKPITLVNGTLVDGCHCKENGVACHPQCGNCH